MLEPIASRRHLGVAGHEHGLVGLRALRVMEDVHHLIEMVLELAVGTEGAGIDGHEEVTDVVWVRRALGEPPDGREGGPGQNAPENMHHHREAVPLVAAHVARTAERRDAALRALEDIAERFLGVRDRLAVAVHRPAHGQRLVVQLVDLDLSRGHGGGGHVEEKGRIALGGRGESEGIGAHDRLRPEGGHHGHAARRRGDHADHPSVGSDLRVAPGGTEVMRVDDRHHRHSGNTALVHGQVHGLRGDGVAE